MKSSVLSVKEASIYLGCSEKTIRNRLTDGILKVSTSVRGDETIIGIKRSELERYRRERTAPSSKPVAESSSSVELEDVPELFSEEVYQAVEQMSVTATALSTNLESFLALNVQVYDSIMRIAENVVALQTIMSTIEKGKDRNNG